MTKKKEPAKVPLKNAPAKKVKNPVGPKIIKPLVIETIRSSEKISDHPVFEKQVYQNIPTVLQPGDVRVIVLKDYNGMLNDLREGDIVDMPERRYKSLAFRGLVRLYDGKTLPNKNR
jgi:hypothetical protein